MKRTVMVMVVCFMLVITSVVPASGYAVDYADTENYKQWSQRDSHWKDYYVYNNTIGSIGCLIVSLTKMLIQAEVKPVTYTPINFTNDMKAAGGFRNTNEIDHTLVHSIAPAITYKEKKQRPSEVEIVQYLKQGYHVILSVQGTGVTGTHFILVDEEKTLAASKGDGEWSPVYIFNTGDILSKNENVPLYPTYTGWEAYLYSGGKTYNGKALTVSTASEQGTITVAGKGSTTSSTTIRYTAGETVTLSYTPAYGYKYPMTWTCSDPNVTFTAVEEGNMAPERVASLLNKGKVTFTMPDHEITVTATPTRDNSVNCYSWNNVKTLKDTGLVSAGLQIKRGDGASYPSSVRFYVIASPNRSYVESAAYNDPGNACVKEVSAVKLLAGSYLLPMVNLNEGMTNAGGSVLSIEDYHRYYYKFVCIADNVAVVSPIGMCGKEIVVYSTNANSRMPFSGSQVCLFWSELRYPKGTRPKEAGIFVSTSQEDAQNATVSSFSNTKKISEAIAPDTSKSGYDFTYLFYNASSSGFSGYTFTSGTTYYFKFYGMSSDGYVNYGPVVSYVYGSAGTGTAVEETTVPVTGITLSETQKSVQIGSPAFTLSCSVAPQNATNKAVNWLSSDPNVATVVNGTVTPVGAGTAVISAVAADGSGVTASCTVTVSSVSVAALIMEKDRDTVSVADGYYTVNVTVIPENATNRSLLWSSSDPGVATVSGGRVTLLKPGTVTITVATQDGSGLSFPFELTVTPVLAETLYLSANSIKLSMNDRVRVLEADIVPTNVTCQTVEWRSSDPSVATVSNGVVTAVAPGECTVTAMTTDGSGLSAVCHVKVDETDVEWIYPEDNMLPPEQEDFVIECRAIHRTEAPVSPGEGWIRGDKLRTVKENDGEPYVSILGPTSSNYKELSYYYYHYCGSSTYGNSYHQGNSTYNHGDTITDVSSVTVAGTSSYTENGIVYPYYILKWKSTGAYAYCKSGTTCDGTYGTHGERSYYWFKRATYQNLKDVDYYEWTRVSDWGLVLDSDDDVVGFEIRYTLKYIPVTEITMDVRSATVKVTDEALVLRAEAFPEKATNRSLFWTSSDPSVVKVEDGVVSFLRPGTATVTCVSADNAAISASCVITVLPEQVTAIRLSDTEKTISLSEKVYQLTAAVEPQNATNPAVTWTSSDTSVATVSDHGTVTLLSPGTVTITCTALDGSGISAVCTLKVEPILVSRITLDRTEVRAEMADGTVTLTAAVEPENATSRAVAWTSSDASVATVSDDGIVTLLSPGTVTVTCTALDGSGVSAACTVTVREIPVEAITLDRGEYTARITEGGVQLTGTVLPANATNTALSWVSSDPSVVTVSDNGYVTFVRPGVAAVTCAARDNSGVSVSCRIIVKPEENLVLPAMLKEIGEEAFMGISAGSVVLPHGVTTIGAKAFASCPDLCFVYIPDTVTGIASDAFADSPNVIFVCDAGSYTAYYAQVKGIPSLTE